MIRTLVMPAMVMLLLLNSCVPPEKLRKETVYFNEGLDTAKLNTYQLVEPVIQKGDLLQISISSRSSSANMLFSQNYTSAPSGAGGANATTTVGGNEYLVDITSGEIKLPLLGIIHADGMTKPELEKEIVKRAGEYLKEDPIVNIRYKNFRVTFHGQVGSPGPVLSTSERLTFLDALAEAGGVAQGGDLKNILIIREQNGKRSMHTVDLTRGDFFQSPNYYLKQNDIVYVQPTKRFLQSTDQTTQRTFQYVSFGLSLINVVVILSTLFR
ncbi:polysaccharide biosynthesis/export family protein [Lacibacter luteus]|nr:polysaccharide biosynthesis/export family protein [Lacibacter luteus]